jgi:thiamine biosynthesis protein ThiS
MELMAELGADTATIEIRVNGAPRSVAAGTMLDRLVAGLGLEPRTTAIERNGEIARRAEWSAIELVAGDRLEIVHFVQGG